MSPSPEEVFVLVAAGLVAVAYWVPWLYQAAETSLLVRPSARIVALFFGLLGSLGVVLAALLVGADPVVKDSPVYMALFLAVAAVALAAATGAGRMIGVSALDDAVRRPNPAAVWAVLGLWVGTALCAAGSNVGRGDTIGTTLGPLALTVAALIALWAVLAAAAGVGAVARDRDRASGVRLAGLLVAWGLILGRSVAGDWESVPLTWLYFAGYGWPALVLLVAGVVLEWWLRPTVRRPTPPRWAGVRPAVAYLVVAVVWVAFLGKP